MASIIRIITGCGFALSIALLFSIAQCAPAYAQGGMVCAYGPQKYRQCCRESFGQHPNLGARARERDIDACMKSKEPPRKKE